MLVLRFIVMGRKNLFGDQDSAKMETPVMNIKLKV